MTTQALPAVAAGEVVLPDDPGQAGSSGTQRYPDAELVAPPAPRDTVTIQTDGPQSYRAGVYTLERAVVLTYGTRTVHADRIVYDSNSGELTATGHLVIDSAANAEHLEASHGEFNLKAGTGRFYDVSGSVGLKPRIAGRRVVYTNANPFVFSGRMVAKTGPESYDVYDGSVTSCLLPKPDWLLSSAHFSVDGKQARARKSTFRLLNLPIVYLPYVTHSLEAGVRQSGFLVPTIGQSNTRGLILGEQIYVTLGRSADLLFGAEYYSSRGFAQNVRFRFRGRGLDFANVRYSGLLDRCTTASCPATGNQGGEDLAFTGRHDFTANTRVAANVEYLSSYVYREAFTDNFNQAITSDVLSTAYGVRETRGIELAALADRYQGIKLLGRPANANAGAAMPQQQVRIFHAPTLSFDSVEHRLPTGLEVSLSSSLSGLKRVQPNFVTSGIIERFDVQPRVAYPFSLGRGADAWRIRPEAGFRETLYTRSRAQGGASQPPVESLAGEARSSFDFGLELRPPGLTRTFTPRGGAGVLGAALRHTIAPELTYRLATGVSNFNRLLRFDPVDIVSNTNELEYGVTQRLYRRTRADKPCADASMRNAEAGLNPAPETGLNTGLDTGLNPQLDDPDNALAKGVAVPMRTAADCGGDDEMISWRLTQKYFFDTRFGKAIVNGRRNLFTTTLALSGVSFLTEPREISPLISRLRVRTSAHTDVEWDFDLDTGARKFTSSNVFVDVHQGNVFGALSYARLDAPGRFYTQVVNDTTTTGVTSNISDFNQLRLLLGYGNPSKRGLSLAGNSGLDLKSFTGTTSSGTTVSRTVYPALIQYLAFQGAYNWNCCGVAFEYREFQLGAIRNSPGYRFSFTLANVGTAGNLRRAERLF